MPRAPGTHPSAIMACLSDAKLSMTPLWTTATSPCMERCGWALTSLGGPWVAQRVCAIPRVLETGEDLSAPSRLATLPCTHRRRNRCARRRGPSTNRALKYGPRSPGAPPLRYHRRSQCTHRLLDRLERARDPVFADHCKSHPRTVVSSVFQTLETSHKDRGRLARANVGNNTTHFRRKTPERREERRIQRILGARQPSAEWKEK